MSGYQKRKEKERLKSERKGLQTLFQVGICANGCDNSSAASAMSAIESTPKVGSTSDDDKQLILTPPIRALSRMFSKH